MTALASFDASLAYGIQADMAVIDLAFVCYDDFWTQQVGIQVSKNAAIVISLSSFIEYDWMIDSSIFKYMILFQSIFANFKPYRMLVITITSQCFFTKGFSDIVLFIWDPITQDLKEMFLQEVQLILELNNNLISISVLNKQDY